MKHAVHTDQRSRAGFTLVEVMIAVAIVALLAAVAVPNYQRARKRGQASRILNDLRVIDGALDRWAIENQKSSSAVATFADLRQYIKTGTPLYETGRDVLGNEFGPTFAVDVAPSVPPASFAALADVIPAEYWSPYQ
jgi:prepilin-type N-terminal cleavage/methylation domain-containing protein